MKFTAEDFRSRLHAQPLDWNTAYQKMADVANERLDLFTDMPHGGCMCQDCVTLRCGNARVSRLEKALHLAKEKVKEEIRLNSGYGYPETEIEIEIAEIEAVESGTIEPV